MPNRITADNEISINGERYRTPNGVQWFDISQPPGKVVVGDTTDESNPLISTWTITDLRGGIGVNIMDVATDSDRLWWGDAQVRHRGHIVLPRLATQTAAASTNNDVQVLASFKNTLYATYGTAIHSYNNLTDSWGAAITGGNGAPLDANATDWAHGLLGAAGSRADTLVIATGSQTSFTTDGATWNQNTGDIKYLEFWNDLLWGINQAGQLYYTDTLTDASDITEWTADAQLQLPDNYVTGLEVARGPDREWHLYASTRVGPFIHDSQNSRFVKIDLDLPFNPSGGDGFEVWRGSIYNSAGLGIYRLSPNSEATVIDVIGPDLNDGLPETKRGKILELLGSHNELIAFVDATDAIEQVTLRSGSGIFQQAGVGYSTFGDSAGFSHILGWDERGWQVKWISDAASRAITAGVVSDAYNVYRLYWALNKRVYYMALNIDVTNPSQVSGQSYGSSGVLETPWFDGGVSNQDKLALSLWVDSTHPSSSATLLFEYATDLSESYTTLATKTASGQTEYTLPSSSDITGVAFNYIKFRVTWTRDSSVTSSPDLHKMFLTWRKRVGAIFGTRVLLDLSQEIGGVPPSQQVKNLLAARYSKPLVEVTWRDDDSTNDPQNYYMDMLNIQFADATGSMSIPPKHALVEFGEPRQSVART